MAVRCWWCALLMVAAACADGEDTSREAYGGSTTSPGPSSAADTAEDPGDETGAGTRGGGASTSGGGTSSGTSSAPDDGEGTGDSGDTADGGDTGSGSIWSPAPGLTWQWQITGTIDQSLDVEAYDIDLFDTDASVIADLRSDGRIVICYFSAGSHEDWRPDADDFPGAAIGSQLDEWPGERWLDHRDPGVRDVMAARLDLAAAKGCDAVEPDNVDGYTNGTGFALSGADQLDYNRWLASQAHARGLSVGLKNDVDQVDQLVDDFDWALNEECMAYDECDTESPFIDAGKAVLHVEYVDDPGDGPSLAASVCPDAQSRQFSTLVKGWDLDAWVIPCD